MCSNGIYGIRINYGDYIRIRYIGSTKDFNQRWQVHRCLLKANKHHNKRLQEDYNKYGVEAFEFVVLEECDSEELYEKEAVYLIVYEDELYNKNYIHKLTKKISNRKPKSSKERKVIFKGEANPSAKISEQEARVIKFLKEFSNMTQKEIADIYGITQQAVNLIGEKRWLHINNDIEPNWDKIREAMINEGNVASF